MEIVIILLAVGIPLSAGVALGTWWERRKWEDKIQKGDLMTPFGATMYARRFRK